MSLHERPLSFIWLFKWMWRLINKFTFTNTRVHACMCVWMWRCVCICGILKAQICVKQTEHNKHRYAQTELCVWVRAGSVNNYAIWVPQMATSRKWCLPLRWQRSKQWSAATNKPGDTLQPHTHKHTIQSL